MADRPRLRTPFDEPPVTEAPAPETPAPPTPPKGRLRFDIGALFGMTFILAFAAAAYRGMMREGDGHAFYVVFALVVPFFALAIASILHRLKRPRSPRTTKSEDGPWD